MGPLSGHRRLTSPRSQGGVWRPTGRSAGTTHPPHATAPALSGPPHRPKPPLLGLQTRPTGRSFASPSLCPIPKSPDPRDGANWSIFHPQPNPVPKPSRLGVGQLVAPQIPTPHDGANWSRLSTPGPRVTNWSQSPRLTHPLQGSAPRFSIHSQLFSPPNRRPTGRDLPTVRPKRKFLFRAAKGRARRRS